LWAGYRPEPAAVTTWTASTATVSAASNQEEKALGTFHRFCQLRAHRLERFVPPEAKQLGLEAERQLTDLVEKRGPIGGANYPIHFLFFNA
jgi:hypothetical protein